MRRNLSLVHSVRTMLRRNEAIKLRNLGLEMTDERRRQLIAETDAVTMEEIRDTFDTLF